MQVRLPIPPFIAAARLCASTVASAYDPDWTQNKAADKFTDLPDEELYEDLKAFVIKGAKDGDAPATCR
jgi:hypothetical protein